MWNLFLIFAQHQMVKFVLFSHDIFFKGTRIIMKAVFFTFGPMGL